MENTVENNNSKKIVVLVTALVVVIAGIILFLNKGAVSHSPTVAVVGEIKITEKDMTYRFGIENAYGNTSFTGAEALQSLVRDATEMEVAKKVGVFPMKVDIVSFKQNADKNTKAPEILNKVKNVFGEDSDSYDRIYILPKIVNPSLHAYFEGNKELNKEALSHMEGALADAKTGKNFTDIAKERNLQYSTSTQSIYPPGVTAEMKKTVEKSKKLPQKSQLMQTLEQMKAGDMYESVIDDLYSYSLVRLLAVENGDYKIEVLSTLKVSYDDWYKKQADQVKVEILKESK